MVFGDFRISFRDKIVLKIDILENNWNEIYLLIGVLFIHLFKKKKKKLFYFILFYF